MPTKIPTTLTGGKKKIAQLMDKVNGKYSGWQVWQDFVYMTAISIANQCPGKYVEEREKTYHKHADNYTADELSLFAQMVAAMIEDLDQNPRQDFLGSLFGELGLNDEWKDQFFTPYVVCEAMAEMSVKRSEDHLLDHGWVNVYDGGCGAGATLIGGANVLKKHGINYQTNALFIAQDIDELAGLMCYIQLSLLGCAGYVYIGDTLAHPGRSELRGLIPEDSPNTWITPIYYTDIWQERIRWNYVDMVIHPTPTKKRKVKPADPAPAEPEGQLQLF